MYFKFNKFTVSSPLFEIHKPQGSWRISLYALGPQTHSVDMYGAHEVRATKCLNLSLNTAGHESVQGISSKGLAQINQLDDIRN
jgi:hypothetical protein